jgi:Tol biopolymer transport system component
MCIAAVSGVLLGHSSAGAAVPGANGRFAYGVWATSGGVKHEIFTVRRNGTDDRRLPVGSASAPQWSPDGRSVAFTRVRAGERAGVWTARADGSSATRVLPLPTHDGQDLFGEMPVWAPDGRRIAYASGWEVHNPEEDTSYGIRFVYVADLDGSPPRQLAEGFWPTWSPDGQRIAFIMVGRMIKVMSPDGSDPQVVARVAGSPWGAMDFSPDGRKLLFAEQRPRRDGSATTVLRLLDLRTGSIRTFNLSGGRPGVGAWAPSGKKIAYLLSPESRPGDTFAPATEIWTMRPDGSHQRRRFTLPGSRQAESLAWQPRPPDPEPRA